MTFKQMEMHIKQCRDSEKRLAAFEQELADYDGITVIPFSATSGEGAAALLDIIRQVTEE